MILQTKENTYDHNNKNSLDVQFAYTVSSLNNNKTHLKICNFHTKKYKMVRNYDIFKIYNDLLISFENWFRI